MMKRIIETIIFSLCVVAVVAAVDNLNIKDEIVTIYDADGRVVGQSQDNKGMHWIIGHITLSNGQADVHLNTSTAESKQDVSFQNKLSYGGYVWTNGASQKTYIYTLTALSATHIRIYSSNTSDNSIVHYMLGGQ